MGLLEDGVRIVETVGSLDLNRGAQNSDDALNAAGLIDQPVYAAHDERLTGFVAAFQHHVVAEPSLRSRLDAAKCQNGIRQLCLHLRIKIGIGSGHKIGK